MTMLPRLRSHAVTAVLFSLLSLPARADPVTARDMITGYDTGTPGGRKLIANMFGSAADGMGWVQAGLKDGARFCQPDALALTNDLVVELVRLQITADPELGRQPYGLVILVTLQRVFPCSSK